MIRKWYNYHDYDDQKMIKEKYANIVMEEFTSASTSDFVAL